MTSHPIITISVSVLWSPVRKSLSCSELPSPWPANQLALQCALLLNALSGRWACHQVGTHTSLAQAVELPVLWGTGVPSGTTVLLDLEEPFSFPFFLFSFSITAFFSQTQLFLCSVLIFFSVYRISGFAFYCCDKEKKTQTMWEGKDLFQLRAHHRGKSGQEFRVGTGGRSWSRDQEGTDLTDSLPMVCSASCLIHSGPPARGWHCPQWDGPSHIHYELRKDLPGLPTGQPGRSILSIQVPRQPGRRQVDKKLTNKTRIYNFNVAKSINSSFIAAITFYILLKSVSLLWGQKDVFLSLPSKVSLVFWYIWKK